MKLIITCIALMISLSSQSQLIGWSFDQVVKFKGDNYKLTNEDDARYYIEYRKELYIDGPKELTHYTEMFIFRKAANKVYAYMFLGAKKETDIANIIETNNQNFKVIDKGKKQTSFEWHDEKTNTVYVLSLMTDIGTGDYKSISYTARGG